MMSRTDAMRALIDLCEAEAEAGTAPQPVEHADTDRSQTGDLHTRVEEAWTALKEFMDGRPDLADPAVRDEYIPIKQRYDDAIETLGRSSTKSIS